jgi:hypothetical protein
MWWYIGFPIGLRVLWFGMARRLISPAAACQGCGLVKAGFLGVVSPLHVISTLPHWTTPSFPSNVLLILLHLQIVATLHCVVVRCSLQTRNCYRVEVRSLVCLLNWVSSFMYRCTTLFLVIFGFICGCIWHRLTLDWHGWYLYVAGRYLAFCS